MIYTGNNAFPEPWQIGAPISSFSLQGGENWVLDHLRGSSNLELICDIRMCPKISGETSIFKVYHVFLPWPLDGIPNFKLVGGIPTPLENMSSAVRGIGYYAQYMDK
jgi:hypothetical protein